MNQWLLTSTPRASREGTLANDVVLEGNFFLSGWLSKCIQGAGWEPECHKDHSEERHRCIPNLVVGDRSSHAIGNASNDIKVEHLPLGPPHTGPLN